MFNLEEYSRKDESLTMWITADKNRIPIKIKADIIVGYNSY